MGENKKIAIAFIISIIIAIPLVILGIISDSTKENYKVDNSIKQGLTEEEYYQKEIEKIRKDFLSSDIKIDYSDENLIKSTLESILLEMKTNNKISLKWSTYSYASFNNYSEDSNYYLSFSCDIDNITNEEIKEIIKDCSQIIWESMNIIYSHPNINNKNNNLEELHYNFSFKYHYIDNYGNTQESRHELSFDISKSSFNRINMETFPSILELDYTKIFSLGETRTKIGTQGIKIDFDNLLTK